MDIKSNELIHVVLKTWLEVSCKISNDLKKNTIIFCRIEKIKKT